MNICLLRDRNSRRRLQVLYAIQNVMFFSIYHHSYFFAILLWKWYEKRVCKFMMFSTPSSKTFHSVFSWDIIRERELTHLQHAFWRMDFCYLFLLWLWVSEWECHLVEKRKWAYALYNIWNVEDIIIYHLVFLFEYTWVTYNSYLVFW